MDNASLDAFLQTVLHDPALQQQLWQARERDTLIDLVQRRAAAEGLMIHPEALRQHMSQSRRDWRDRPTVLRARPALDNWVPIRIDQRGPEPAVEWCYIGQRHFAEPFFEQTITACLWRPLNMLVRFQTPMSVLDELQREQPGMQPSGFIFHMSRCGSTLLAQMLAALDHTLVLSEAEPIDGVLRAQRRDPGISDGQQEHWLRAMVGALGRPRRAQEQQLFIKLDSWSVLDLPLIRRVFPTTPCLFLYRDPVEVLVSHQRLRGSQMVPGLLEPTMLGLTGQESLTTSLDDYAAHVLGCICAAAVAGAERGDLQLVHYRQLPEVVWSSLLAEFGVDATEDEQRRLRDATSSHAKQPGVPFAPDGAAKQQAASPSLRALAERQVGPHYRRLLALQQAQDGLPSM